MTIDNPFVINSIAPPRMYIKDGVLRQGTRNPIGLRLDRHVILLLHAAKKLFMVINIDTGMYAGHFICDLFYDNNIENYTHVLDIILHEKQELQDCLSDLTRSTDIEENLIGGLLCYTSFLRAPNDSCLL